MPISTHDETSAAADLGRGAQAPLPREGGRNHTRIRTLRSVTGLVLIAALAGGLFTWSVNSTPDTLGAAPTADLRSWLDDHPDDALAWQQLGDLYLVDATAADDLAAYLSAVDALEMADSLEPTQIETTRSLAVASVGLHRFDTAATHASAVLDRRPDDRIALAALVDSLVELGRYDDAAAASDRLARLRPDSISLSRRSYVRQLTGDLEGAIDSMYAARTASLGSPIETARLSTFLAELHRLRGDRTLATDLYREALTDADTASRATVGLAQVAAGDGDFAESLRLLDSRGSASNSLAALQTQGRVMAASGDDFGLARALEQVRAVVDGSIAADIGVDPSEVLFEADFGDPERASELAQLVLVAQPDGIYAHRAAAWAAFVDGDVTSAVEHIDQATRTGVQDPLVLAHAALIRHAAGDDDGAARDYAAAIRLDPGVVRAYDGLRSDMFTQIALSAEEATP